MIETTITIKNKKSIEESEFAGCCKCLNIFSTKDIINWTDNFETALCPFCNEDCVIAQSHGILLDEKTLKEMQLYWF